MGQVSMTLDEVRRLAFALPEVTEEPHFHYTSFRVRGKIFATAPPDGDYLHVFVNPEQRERALEEHPDFLNPLLWGGKVRGLRVLLPLASRAAVGALLKSAWRLRAPRRLAASVDVNESSLPINLRC